MAKPIIEVENISKRYSIGRKESYGSLRDEIMQALASPFRRKGKEDGADSIWALKDVSFTVEEGEVLGIIGRNGAGKSTLLKILSRITEPTTGRITMRGRVASLLEVGTGFHPELTGRENIFLNGALLGMSNSEIKAKLDEIVAFSEIEKFLDTPVKRYSSGMYVRLAFAVAAHLEPEILIIDEVLAVGDAAFQKKCLGKMNDVAKGGRTVLFVSHNMAAVLEMTNRCVLLGAGKFEMEGKPADVVGMYLHTGKSPTLSRDLSETRGKVEDKLWKITHVRILNAVNGNVRYKSPIEVEIEYHSHQTVEDVVVGIIVADMFGTRHIHCRSTDNKLKISTIKGETGKIRIRIDSVYLPPGKYMIGLGAMTGGSFSLDYVPEALVFEIAFGLDEMDDSWVLGRTNLGARLPSVWERHGMEDKKN